MEESGGEQPQGKTQASAAGVTEDGGRTTGGRGNVVRGEWQGGGERPSVGGSVIFPASKDADTVPVGTFFCVRSSVRGGAPVGYGSPVPENAASDTYPKAALSGSIPISRARSREVVGITRQ